MKQTLKMLLVMTAALGMSGYARGPQGETASFLQGQPTATALVDAPGPARATESPEPSELTLLLCGFLVVGVIARRKSRLVAG